MQNTPTSGLPPSEIAPPTAVALTPAVASASISPVTVVRFRWIHCVRSPASFFSLPIEILALFSTTCR